MNKGRQRDVDSSVQRGMNRSRQRGMNSGRHIGTWIVADRVHEQTEWDRERNNNKGSQRDMDRGKERDI